MTRAAATIEDRPGPVAVDGVLVDEAGLAAAVSSVLGSSEATPTRWWIEPVEHDLVAASTAALFRARGVSAGGAPWSLFGKVLRSFRHWPVLDILPAELRERALADTRWRAEADLYSSALPRVLPVGLRTPVLHGLDDLGDEHLLLWLEDVVTADVTWDRARYERAARGLGRLAARLTRLDVLPRLGAPREGNHLWYTGRLLPAALPALRAARSDPRLAAALDTTLWDDLATLAARLPGLLGVLDRLPQTLAHGDACPQNLLVPAADPDGFVVIDWMPAGPVAVGADLGQLLIGRAHSGALDVDDLAALHDPILAAYTAGLADEGMPVEEETVRVGFDGTLILRSAFTALPLERLAEPPTAELTDLLARRARLTRYLVDLGLALPTG